LKHIRFLCNFMAMGKKNILIMGAAGRDFHNFNVLYRDNTDINVVAFTAAQIPDIDERLYPPELAGRNYPEGIPIVSEEQLPRLIKDHKIEEVVFSYSDVSNQYVMERAAMALSLGADFKLLGAGQTMLESNVPVIAICAVRTGCGKSQTTRRIANILKEMGSRVVVVRHPMPYGYLKAQEVQRFETIKDMEDQHCTIEEMEEYEPHIRQGFVVYAGVDYGKILRSAEKEADIILWDGGNNDLPFFKPDIHITVTDPFRAGHELNYYPGRINLILADIVVINKVDTADYNDVLRVRESIDLLNPSAAVIEAASPIFMKNREAIKGKKVLVVEDGPTLTHGGMKFGAGVIAAKRFGAGEIIDPREYTAGKVKLLYEKYPDIGPVLPAVGYGEEQIRDLEKTINHVPAELVIIATPVDLTRIIKIDKEMLKVDYELEEIGEPSLRELITEKLASVLKNCK